MKLVLAILLTLCTLCTAGCGKATPAYYTVSEHYTESSHTGVICDGEYLYDYNYVTGEKTNKRLTSLEDSSEALQLRNVDVELVFTPDEVLPATYTCDFDVISCYINKLMSNKYKVVEYELCSQYIDYRLQDAHSEVRVIWKVDGTCQIFAVNSRKSYTNPPYING